LHYSTNTEPIRLTPLYNGTLAPGAASHAPLRVVQYKEKRMAIIDYFHEGGLAELGKNCFSLYLFVGDPTGM